MKKPKKPTSNFDPTYVRQLQNFVDFVLQYTTIPAKWPLTQDEQISFVRNVTWRAREIQALDGYKITNAKLFLHK